MIKICLIGPVDKRIIAYPLIKVLDNIGKTLVVTDDANFRRFSDDYGNDFAFGRSEALVVRNVQEIESKEKIPNMSGFDFVVFVTTNELIKDSDLIVYCHGANRSLVTPDVLEELEGIEYKEVLLSNVKNTDKNVLKVPVVTETIDYVWKCEEAKVFLPSQSKTIAGPAKHLFGDLVKNYKNKEVSGGFAEILAKRGVK